MADKDFDFDNFLTTKKDKQTDVALSNTSFSPGFISFIRPAQAFAWWERVSQRKWIENCIESLLAEYGQDKIDQIRLKYREESEEY